MNPWQKNPRMDSDAKQLLAQLGTRIRKFRTQRRMTLRALAERAHLSLRFIAQLEAGKSNIAISRLAALARALEVSMTDLLVEEKGSIALLGLRGAGKSTIGPRLAELLSLPFVELDDLIEDVAGLNLAEIFALHGEAYYRRLEGQCLSRLLAKGEPAVIALPGGIVHNNEAFILTKRYCTTVWLKANPEDHMKRVLLQGDPRPMAGRPNAMAELRAILSAREPIYKQADVTIDTSNKSLSSTVDAIIAALNMSGRTPFPPGKNQLALRQA